MEEEREEGGEGGLYSLRRTTREARACPGKEGEEGMRAIEACAGEEVSRRREQDICALEARAGSRVILSVVSGVGCRV